jgi:hypothetical protein
MYIEEGSAELLTKHVPWVAFDNGILYICVGPLNVAKASATTIAIVIAA